MDPPSSSACSEVKQEKEVQSEEKRSPDIGGEDDYMHCNFIDIRFHMEKAFETGKTVLIIDNSEDEKVCTYLSYQTDIGMLEAKAMIQKYSSNSLLAALEYGRRLLVNAMKHGKTLVIRLGSSAPDFKDSFHDDKLHEVLMSKHRAKLEKAREAAAREEKDGGGQLVASTVTEPPPELECYFPKEVLMAGGRFLRDTAKAPSSPSSSSSFSSQCKEHTPSSVSSSRTTSNSHQQHRTWAEKLFRDEDSFPHKNIAYCRDEFRVCLVSQLDVSDIDEYLFGNEWGGLPAKELFQILIVNTDDSDDDADS
mmetsp:Transcript_24839/g.42049  ORF Transcript_24839/g.42049 Transcript_24839/m.42049 type:complete len:308 (-) Transcript_24839:38-961(-)